FLRKAPRLKGRVSSASGQEGEFVREKRIVREFGGQLFEVSTRQPNLPLPQSCQREQDLRKRPEVVPLPRRNPELTHSQIPVTLDTAQPQKEPLVGRQTDDDEVSGTKP